MKICAPKAFRLFVVFAILFSGSPLLSADPERDLVILEKKIQPYLDLYPKTDSQDLWNLKNALKRLSSGNLGLETLEISEDSAYLAYAANESQLPMQVRFDSVAKMLRLKDLKANLKELERRDLFEKALSLVSSDIVAVVKSRNHYLTPAQLDAQHGEASLRPQLFFDLDGTLTDQKPGISSPPGSWDTAKGKDEKRDSWSIDELILKDHPEMPVSVRIQGDNAPDWLLPAKVPALERLIERCLAAGDREEAIFYMRQLAAIFPLSEPYENYDRTNGGGCDTKCQLEFGVLDILVHNQNVSTVTRGIPMNTGYWDVRPEERPKILAYAQELIEKYACKEVYDEESTTKLRAMLTDQILNTLDDAGVRSFLNFVTERKDLLLELKVLRYLEQKSELSLHERNENLKLLIGESLDIPKRIADIEKDIKQTRADYPSIISPRAKDYIVERLAEIAALKTRLEEANKDIVARRKVYLSLNSDLKAYQIKIAGLLKDTMMGMQDPWDIKHCSGLRKQAELETSGED